MSGSQFHTIYPGRGPVLVAKRFTWLTLCLMLYFHEDFLENLCVVVTPCLSHCSAAATVQPMILGRNWNAKLLCRSQTRRRVIFWHMWLFRGRPALPYLPPRPDNSAAYWSRTTFCYSQLTIISKSCSNIHLWTPLVAQSSNRYKLVKNVLLFLLCNFL